ncbi:Arm DNA-binding domain-containing protein [Wielerella bovis]|uniref:Arm DNA-binding domain-containing protein n=1 Tax=Wielerella bovis TaxID=2917790 RepID=UPI0020184E57|nr:Arm DNA-binding domain-containing protein [Wielerella bovis]ULJ63749.1 Arm DNA-binding domain-containing protein [Wielerella bovis]ULJ66083.1 Arm DNA-binding domain-containing protein [Wielerella bovis]
MALNDKQIRLAKAIGKKQKLTDGNGLYLEITPKGTKVFRFDFAIQRKRQTLTIGKYPAVSLSEARIAAENARIQVSLGNNPATAKQETIAARKTTFFNITTQWHNAY